MKTVSYLPLLAAACLALAGSGCSGPPPDPGGDGPAGGGAAAHGLPDFDSRSWVRIYDPERAWNGYTLLFYGARIPMLVDMNGRVVHAWPEVRVKSRVRLLEDGSILAIALGRAIAEYDWEGNLVREVPLPELLPHHDVIRLANGNTMVIVGRKGEKTDDLLEIDGAGETVWHWRAAEHLAHLLPEEPTERRDLTHINSVQELPPNRHHRAGDRRFAPGNLLVSARNMNLAFVVDRQTGEVVWTWGEGLDMQHEALMLGPGLPGHGRIQVFSNGYWNLHDYRASRILEVEPARDEVVWQYRSDGFFSPTGGVQQPLANGNVLIGSTRGGRVFEVTREGEIVWQWAAPFDPVRPGRYAYDHCPQLASLPRPAEVPVRPPPGYRHVDPPIYRFASGRELRKVDVDRKRRFFLADNGHCQRLRLPAAPTVQVTYGLDGRWLGRRERRGQAVRFALLVAAEGGERVELFSDRVPLKKKIDERTRTLGLEPWATRPVEMCVVTEGVGRGGGEAAERVAFWESPLIRPGDLFEEPAEVELAAEDLTPEEAEARREHLRTLGYVQ